MRVETGLIDRKGQQFCQLPAVGPTGDKTRARRGRRRQRKMPKVVKLFKTCKEVFSGPGTVPSPNDVDRLRSVLDSMTPQDVGLNPDMPYFQTTETEGLPPITYLQLYECNKFSIAIFCFPPSGIIPLHNHPGMTVFSKLLFGSVHIKSYDWADIPCNAIKTLNPSHFQPPGVRLAKVKVDAVFNSPCNASILYPAAGGNMHRFTAMTSCAVLDVLGPPYSDPEGRHCTYYQDFPYASFSGEMELGSRGEGYAWLEEKEKPDDFRMVGRTYELELKDDLCVVGRTYGGPKVVDH